MSELIQIDGGRGEGGGQVLRTSLSLAAALGRPVRIERVRAGRKQPGLLRQHLTALQAAREITAGGVIGAELGSGAVELHPGPVRPGDYHFAVGTAGSTTLVLQTVLMPLALAGGTSTVRIEGGTHNAWAPPFTFLARCFLPQLARMGVAVEARLVRPGFHPAGGGELEITIQPARDPGPLELCERGAPAEPSGEVVVSQLRETVADREVATLRTTLGWRADQVAVCDLSAESRGPGNAIHVILPFEHVTEVATAFGRRGLPAQEVARAAVVDARAFLGSTAPVGEHLADQLLLPMVLLAGGRFVTGPLSSHTKTNLDTIAAFLPGRTRVDVVPSGHRISVSGQWPSRGYPGATS